MEGNSKTWNSSNERGKMEELPKFLRNERRVKEKRLQQLTNERGQEDLRKGIGPQHRGGFQPPTGQNEQWTVDPFWEMDRPFPVQSSQAD